MSKSKLQPIDVEKLRARLESDEQPANIRRIRFPLFKALEPNLTIEFTFPITALVGQNGSNKSSILHALSATPDRQSLANRWFSTSLDPIEELDAESAHRFIYSYRVQGRKGTISEAVVRKSRVTREFRNTWIPKAFEGQKDPDYWEPTKWVPEMGDPLPEGREFEEFLTKEKTRWKVLSKNLVYLDFRDELSAFDKFINHSAPDAWTRNRTERRYRVITRSKQLSKAFRKMKADRPRVPSAPRLLKDSEVAIIGEILGKNFKEIKILKHRCYGVDGYSATISFGERTYSEANAGSGEFAVIRLVDEISRAKNRSLILLDEPEVSLHPGAQKRLIQYIAAECVKHGHQVVISTHSPEVIHELPDDAVKLLGTDGTSNTVRLLSQSTPPHQAFFNLGHEVGRNKKRIFVEDKLVAEMVENSIQLFDSTMLPTTKAVPFPGGADRIIQDVIPMLAESETTDVVVLLDGDQLPKHDPKSGNGSILRCSEPPLLQLNKPSWRNPNWNIIDTLSIEPDPACPSKLAEEWRILVTRLLGPKASFDIHGHARGEMENARIQIVEIRRNLLWCKKNLHFLAGNVPEAMLTHEMDDTYDASTETQAAKAYYVKVTQEEFGRGPGGKPVTSTEILDTQKRYIARVSKKKGRDSLLLVSAFHAASKLYS